MQNIDFYNKHTRSVPQNHFGKDFASPDPEYFSRMSKAYAKDSERNKKKASRMLFFIAALCIISFTTGIVLGLKFAGGTNKEIVDQNTMNAVSDIGKKMSGLIKNRSKKNTTSSAYSKEAYPYLIRIKGFQRNELKNVAAYLSKKGNKKFTIIVTKKNIYIPQKSKKSAKNLFDKIVSYKKYSFRGKTRLFKR